MIQRGNTAACSTATLRRWSQVRGARWRSLCQPHGLSVRQGPGLLALWFSIAWLPHRVRVHLVSIVAKRLQVPV